MHVTDHMKSLAEYLDSESPSATLDKIRRFNRTDLRGRSGKNLSDDIMDILLAPPDSSGNRWAHLPYALYTYPIETRFFRARRPGAGKTGMDCTATTSDAWEPPPHLARKSRLNAEGESVLYLAPMDSQLALEETRVGNGEEAAIYVFRAIEPITTCVIGARMTNTGLTDTQALRLSMLTDFIEALFGREVGAGTEHLYDASRAIAIDYYDYPSEISHGWCYLSALVKSSENVCLRPPIAHSKLDLLGAAIGTKTQATFQMRSIAVPDNERLVHFPPGTPQYNHALQSFEPPPGFKMNPWYGATNS